LQFPTDKQSTITLDLWSKWHVIYLVRTCHQHVLVDRSRSIRPLARRYKCHLPGTGCHGKGQ